MPRVKPPQLPGPYAVRAKVAVLRDRLTGLTADGRTPSWREWQTLHADVIRVLVEAINNYTTVSNEIVAVLRADRRMSETLKLHAQELLRETAAIRALLHDIETARAQGVN